MPLLRGCCTLDLQVGTKIIGVVNLILSLLGFLSSLLMLGVYMIMKDIFLQQMRIGIEQGFANQPTNAAGDGVYSHEEDDLTKAYVEFIEQNSQIIMYIILAILCLQLHDIICCSCLIHGVRKNVRGLIMPWIVTHIFYILLDLAFVIVLFVVIGYIPPFYKLVLPMIAAILLWMALHIYLVLVVISQFQALGLIRMHDEMCMK